MNRYILIMGICGTGKSTIASTLATHWSLPFIEADQFHPLSNVSKMSLGTPLTDEDRQPWLENIAQELTQYLDTGFVLACSALKSKYRDILASKLPSQMSIYLLNGSKEIIENRMKLRNHFMPTSLINSQMSTLEVTSDIYSIDINQTALDISKQIISHQENVRK